MPRQSACKGCGASVIWVRTERGKMIPLNYEPDPQGNFVIIDGIAMAVKKTDMGEGGFGCFDADLLRYMPHHATCPQVGLFRKTQRTARG